MTDYDAVQARIQEIENQQRQAEQAAHDQLERERRAEAAKQAEAQELIELQRAALDMQFDDMLTDAERLRNQVEKVNGDLLAAFNSYDLAAFLKHHREAKRAFDDLMSYYQRAFNVAHRAADHAAKNAVIRVEFHRDRDIQAVYRGKLGQCYHKLIWVSNPLNALLENVTRSRDDRDKQIKHGMIFAEYGQMFTELWQVTAVQATERDYRRMFIHG